MSNKAGQLVIALKCGMDSDHDIIKQSIEDADAFAESFLSSTKLEKSDLFGVIGTNDTFFRCDEVWNNLDAVVGFLRQNGVEITGSDFCNTPVLNEKTALDFAAEKRVLDKLFTPTIWKGHLAEMEKAWFAIERNKRDFSAFKGLRREIADAGGEAVREDEFDRVNITIANLRRAVSDGEYKELNQKLESGGDHLRASDVLVPDEYGDHALDNLTAWNNFDKLLDELDKNDERLEVHHFLHNHHGRKSPLTEALSIEMGHKIFSVRMWRGRPQEMMALYEHVPVGERAKVPINKVLAELEDDLLSGVVKIKQGMKKGELTAALNYVAHDGAQVRGLSLKTVWENIEQVRGFLREGNESLSLEDLRITSGRHEESALLAAARFGKFDQVMDMLQESGEELALADLTARAAGEKNILEILTENQQLDTIVRPELWAHRTKDFHHLWTVLPNSGREQLDYNDLVSRMNVIALRHRFAGSQGTDTTINPEP